MSALTEQVAALVARQTEQRLADLDALRERLPLTDPDRHAIDTVDTACCRMRICTPDAEVITVQRQAALLKAIKAEGGRWKSGRTVRLYEALGYGHLSKGTAARDLLALSSASHLIRHETDGVRYFTLNTRKDAS
jgi:hypothetical protein